MRVDYAGTQVAYGTGSGKWGDGPNILFIHGAGFDHSVWVMPARFFARHGLNVLAPDLPAHGATGGTALTSINAMADWCAGLCAELLDGPVTVVGHSMGSLVAMQMALAHPAQVSQVALLGTSTPMPVGAVLLDATEDNDHAGIDMANAWSHSREGQFGAGAVPGISNLNSGERLLERNADGVYHADFAACNAYTLAAELPDVAILVIAGEEDKMTPARAGLKFASTLSLAETVLIPGCGHAMLSEKPNEVLDALAEFVLQD
ncbi:MAG: alpha/beta hydrolase [Pseudomonadota bacterium]